MELPTAIASIVIALTLGAMSPGPSFVRVVRTALAIARRDALSAAPVCSNSASASGAAPASPCRSAKRQAHILRALRACLERGISALGALRDGLTSFRSPAPGRIDVVT